MVKEPVGDQAAPASEHWMSRGVLRTNWQDIHLQTVFCAGWRTPGVTRCRLHCSLQEGDVLGSDSLKLKLRDVLTIECEYLDHCLET